MFTIGDEDYEKHRQAHFVQSRKLIRANAGKEVKTIGDAFFPAFRSVDKALDFALGAAGRSRRAGHPDTCWHSYRGNAT